MPYVSRELLRAGLAALNQSYSPLVLVSIPCMLSHGVPTCTTAAEAREKGANFGATEERLWLDDYFRVAGGPPGKPYYMPGTGEWVQERYPDRSLQRRRKDFEDSVFFHPTQKMWAFRPDAAEVVSQRLVAAHEPISLVALMTWMWRQREIESLDGALDDFKTSLNLGSGVFKDVYAEGIPKEFHDAGLSPEPLTDEEIAELLGAAPPPPSIPSLKELIDEIQNKVSEAHFRIGPGLVARIVGGWLVQDIVVLVGPTGSGKTTIARLIVDALQEAIGDDRLISAFLEVSPDYDLAQFLGYENLAGEFTPGHFANESLFVGNATDPRVVVLDEWNLAQIDAYFAPVLSAVESDLPLHLPGRVDMEKLSEDERYQLKLAQPEVHERRWRLPVDTFFLATCNSWSEEPETRLPISGPVKRRCRIISMPNILRSVLDESGRDGLVGFCDDLITQERVAVEQRLLSGSRASVFDSHRSERLKTIARIGDLPEQTVDRLINISRILLEIDQSGTNFTPGILKDLVLACVYAEPGDELAALGEQVADKLLHQVQGDTETLRVLQGETNDLPNSDEINALIERMGGLGGEQHIKPLV